MVKYDLERITETRIPLSMFTDSKSLFDGMVKNTVLTEKRLMIDLRVAWEAYHLNEISDIGFIRGEPADYFTKVAHNDAVRRIVFDGLCDIAMGNPRTQAQQELEVVLTARAFAQSTSCRVYHTFII